MGTKKWAEIKKLSKSTEADRAEAGAELDEEIRSYSLAELRRFDATTALVVDLGSIETGGRSGAVWSLPHGGDLDGNLVRIEPDGAIDPHVNAEVDVLISVVAGHGHLVVDGISRELRGDMVALVPKGTRRSIGAGADGISYLSIHRRREPLGITANPKAQHDC
jgi:quercetin dioxygenase-like cupin family protein